MPGRALRRVRAEDGGDLPAPPRQRAERLDPPRPRRPGSLLAWARERDLRVRRLLQAAHARERARAGGGVDARADRRRAERRRHLLPALPAARDAARSSTRAYPRAQELFALKRRLDPEFRLRNVLWDKYYAPTLAARRRRRADARSRPSSTPSTGRTCAGSDAFYRFLQNIYRLYPEDRFHTLIKEACAAHGDDEAIYRHAAGAACPTIKPFLADPTYALPSLAKQKQEMARQTLELAGRPARLRRLRRDRHHRPLRERAAQAPALHGAAGAGERRGARPTRPVDIVERGQLGKLGTLRAAGRLRAHPGGRRARRQRRPRDLLHRPAPLPAGEAGAPSCARSRACCGRAARSILRDHDVTTPADGRVRLARAHRVQRRPAACRGR